MAKLTHSQLLQGFMCNIVDWTLGENKANSKPNKANLFRIEYCVMRIAKRNLKKQNQSRPSAGNTKH